jgi:hypothetical protein
MSFLKLTCPQCSQPIEAPAEAVGQEVTCPTCNRKFLALAPARVPQEPSGLGGVDAALPGFFAVAGAIAWALGRFTGLFEDENAKVLLYLGAVAFGFGVAWFCHRMIAGGANEAGFNLLTVGLFVVGASLLAGWYPAMTAGGFLAVIGAVLILKK